MTTQFRIQLPAYDKGYHIITHHIERVLKGNLPDAGIVNIFIQHTSAGISINENADPSVRVDFASFFGKLVPENLEYFTHTMEGADDMPAHILASIFGNSISIPIINGKLGLGMWQGIYLGEFRNYGGERKLVVSVVW